MREEAEKLNILLVYIPPYSPDLNPIENVWKSVKRVASEESPLNVEELKNTIAKAFKKLTGLDWEILGDKFVFSRNYFPLPTNLYVKFDEKAIKWIIREKEKGTPNQRDNRD